MKITVLVGPPCSGKSSFLKRLDYDFAISSDAIVEQLCRHNEIAYHQFFQLPANHIIRQQHKHLFEAAIEQSKQYQHVIWDLTNLTRKSRARIFSYYPSAEFNAVVFDFVGYEHLLLARNEQRSKLTGKYIDPEVLRAMCQSYQTVDLNEGFRHIEHVSIVND
ncbi:ATP-binding protein [Thalassotalea ponticola]|uniref:ATP-binding protein n=1 Tax=Thalassotalea ponticola TaxID=1523392 RepID=UPI0025B3EC17|nr:ATP-binding protein [Thalassotalea ponticola]MDN3651820.1 ATP-binding protein [Thalassotalea ponticola]